MLLILGKRYSLETQATLQYFERLKEPFNYIDLEEDPHKQWWCDWIKSERILSIPVVLHKASGQFAVGFDTQAFSHLLEVLSTPPQAQS